MKWLGFATLSEQIPTIPINAISHLFPFRVSYGSQVFTQQLNSDGFYHHVGLSQVKKRQGTS